MNLDAPQTIDIAIIGAGPAGIASAIQLRRYGCKPVVFEKDRLGGLLPNANLVENYPGFPDGISGRKLADLFVKQLRTYDVEIIQTRVNHLDFANDQFIIESRYGRTFAKRIIIATGTKARTFSGIKFSDQVRQKVFYEISEILDVSAKTILIIGAGDAAFDYALNLSKQNRVFILNRSDIVKCLPLLKKRAEAQANITYLEQIKMESVYLNPGGSLDVKCDQKSTTVNLTCDFLVAAIGREINLDVISENIRNRMESLSENGRLYLIGDVKNGIYRQTSIAVGDGVRAAMQVFKNVEGERL